MRAAATRALTPLAAVSALLLCAPLAIAQDDTPGEILLNARMAREKLARSSAALSTSGTVGDTVYLGHSYTDHTGAPGPIVNPWNLYTGTYRPGQNDPSNTVWDWDHTTGIGADSLAGWWPFITAYAITGGLVLSDNNRPWWAIDQGNIGNQVAPPGAGGKRTKGVVGFWHDDAGVGQGSAVTWSPIGGTRSAWCGLRQHGDVSAMDPVTGNPYNQTVLETQNMSNSGHATTMNFPGYTNQMDQLLYRDVVAAAGQPLTLSFRWRTRMSTGVITTAVTRTGWFDKDPLDVTAGNFISSSGSGVNAPTDSFLVYVGAPVDDASCVFSDGTTAPVYDLQRRWFSEVLRVNEGPSAPYFRLLGVSGHSPADTLSPANVSTIVVPASAVDAIRGAAGNDGRVRIVFRVKTNQSFSDADSRVSSYTSGGHGAAIVDDISVDTGAGPVSLGDFETPQQGGPGSIDNRISTTALSNWKSTGKPPPVYFHPHVLSELTYADICGPPDSPARRCNLGGVVIVAGNHDDGERHGDSRKLAWREVQHGILSPTIDLVTPLDGSPNAQGLTTASVDATDDLYVAYDVYTGMMNLAFTGNAWTYGAQSYPAQQSGNGALVWGAMRSPPFQISNPDQQCFTDLQALRRYGMIVTSDPSGVPDSLRIWLGMNQQCFRFSISLGCNSSEGAYFDNVSLAFIDVPMSTPTSSAMAVSLGAMSVEPWDLYNDAFPANSSTLLPGTAAFDTCGAWLQTGRNGYPNTGDALRNVVPGDSMVVVASNATVTAPDASEYAAVRVDLVFRVLPGPGNYRIATGRNYPPDAGMQLLRTPQDQALIASSGDASFWGQLLANPGEFAKGTHFGGTRWDHLTWNSVRCDTAELNRFPVAGIGINTGLAVGRYASMIHESDPRFAALGIVKNRCFLINPASTTVNHTNITCTTVPAWVTSGAPGNGYDGSPTTREFTKILPDGLLTPGSHVQYFFRKSHAVDPLLTHAMVPDTHYILPQQGEGSSDGHRWQQFGVLPDRWKDPAFDGAGMACVLVVDGNDRRGDERAWVSVMDSILMTIVGDRGNHNGWGGVPDSLDYSNLPVTDPRLATYVVSNKNKHAGTLWDLYSVKGAESSTTGNAGSIGSRLSNPAIGFGLGKDTRLGPTPQMLRTYYRMIVYLSGDLSSGVLGPYANRSQDDVAILDDFLRNASGSPQPRGLFVIGDGFVQSAVAAGGVTPVHTDFLAQRLGVQYRDGAYQAISGNTAACAELLSSPQITFGGFWNGLLNTCTAGSNDVLLPDAAMPEAASVVHYENVGVNGPYVAGVLKPTSGSRPWIAMTMGVDLDDVVTQYCATARGRAGLLSQVLDRVFSSICRLGPKFQPILDVPGTGARDLLHASLLLKGNVQRTGPTQVVFTSPDTRRIRIELHDVAGRRVRQLADRVFRAGEHTLTWDGLDDAGVRAARGVYFLRMVQDGEARDLTGRVVVLR